MRRSLRDSQRNRMYKAEATCKWYHGEKVSRQEIEEFIGLVMEDNMPSTRYELKFALRGCAHYRPTSAFASWMDTPDACEFKFSRGTMTLAIVLHEVAHAMTHSEAESHGPVFCHAFLKLLKEYLGEAYANEMAVALTSFGVMVDPEEESSVKAAQDQWDKIVIKYGMPFWSFPLTPTIHEVLEASAAELREKRVGYTDRMWMHLFFRKTRMYFATKMDREHLENAFSVWEKNCKTNRQKTSLENWKQRVFQQVDELKPVSV